MRVPLAQLRNYGKLIGQMSNPTIKTRIDLAKHFEQLGFKVGAEIGVAEGTYALELCKAIPGLKYYGVDTWPVGGRHLIRARYKLAKNTLAPYDATLIRKTSMEAVKDFEKASLDFVYIDATHYFDDVVKDIIEWTKKVKKGGIVSGHDYRAAGGVCGVIDAVNGFVHAHSYSLNLTTDSSETISWWFNKRWNT